MYSRIARTQRREAMRREKERQNRVAAGYGGQSGSDSEYSDASDDSDAERRRRIAKAESETPCVNRAVHAHHRYADRFFAPPKAYDNAASGTDGPAAGEEFPIFRQPEQPASEENAQPVPITEAAANDWASWSATPAVSDDPYTRRMALAAGTASAQVPFSTVQLHGRQDDDDRRPPAAQVLSSHSSFPLAGGSGRPRDPAFRSADDDQPYLEHESASMAAGRSVSDANAPSSDAIQVSSTAPVVAVNSSIIEEAQAKARAIAAKLAAFGKLGGPAPTTVSVNPASMPPIPGLDEPIPGLGPIAPVSGNAAPKAEMYAVCMGSVVHADSQNHRNSEEFAAHFMAKYGWSKGQGLGATQQGMLNPLAVSGTASAATSKKAKRKFAEAAAANKPIAKVTGMATAKGRIISDSRAEQNKSDKDKYGVPTRIVCLMNMVGREEVDEDLSSDVAEEARKHGVLERCFVHVMPAYAADEDSVRVFLVYSGLVGAYNAVKAFDARFFGGRTVKAKFYDEKLAIAGNLHL